MSDPQEWYYMRFGERFGPFSAVELKQLATASKFIESDLVIRTGWSDWKFAGDMNGLFDERPSSSLTRCHVCKHQISTEALHCPKCGKPNPTSASISGAGCIGCLVSLLFIGGCGAVVTQGIFSTGEGNQVAEPAVEQLSHEEVIAEQKYGKKPYNDPWDGSVLEVERHMDATLNDPDPQVSRWWPAVIDNVHEGWAVQCRYRARNLLGGYVLRTDVFIIRHGHVVDVIPY